VGHEGNEGIQLAEVEQNIHSQDLKWPVESQKELPDGPSGTD